MDIVDKQTRKLMMSRVKGKNTAIEIEMRKSIFALGLRYRIHDKNVIGKPDLVFRRYKTAVLINGCFWHLHGCRYSKIPSTNSEWWQRKLENNKKHDKMVLENLKSEGWRVILIWGCVIKGQKPSARNRKFREIGLSVREFMKSDRSSLEIDIDGNREIWAQQE